MTVLSRRTKNNPILIGEPGVGTTRPSRNLTLTLTLVLTLTLTVTLTLARQDGHR